MYGSCDRVVLKATSVDISIFVGEMERDMGGTRQGPNQLYMCRVAKHERERVSAAVGVLCCMQAANDMTPIQSFTLSHNPIN